MNDKEEALDDLDSDIDSDSDKDLFGDSFDLGYNDYMDENSTEPMQKHSELLKELTDFDKELNQKVNSWLGRVWDSKSEKYVLDQYNEPIMNEKGAKWCISFLKNYAKKPNILTHILKSDYNYIHHDIIEVLWEEFATKCEDFGVDNLNDLKRICVELEHSAILVLMGAGDGKYSKLLKESTHRTENVQFTNPNGMVRYGGMNPQGQKKPTGWEKLRSKFGLR